MKTVAEMIDETIGKEGRYSNNPDDTGGETMWGITKAAARANGYQGPMIQLPREAAVAIYTTEYFVKPGFALIHAVSSAIGTELFDTGVNCGPSVPAKFLQRLLNALNAQGTLYSDLTVDGVIGARTLTALRAYLTKRGQAGENVLLKGLNCLQGAYYLELTEKREKNETFFYGWMANRVGMGA